MRETGYAPVNYIPRQDADTSTLTRTDHASHCPYRGNASYFTISAGGRGAENTVWSYEQPYPAMAEIKGYSAFDPRRVDKIEEG